MACRLDLDLSPRLLCSVLQWGMPDWRLNAETKKSDWDLGINILSLLDTRFAHDILRFARTAAEALALVDDLLRISQHIGLRLKGWIQRKQLFLLQGFNRHFSCIQWNEIRSPEATGGTQMVWLHHQRCRIKEHESGSPTSLRCVKGFHANRKT